MASSSGMSPTSTTKVRIDPFPLHIICSLLLPFVLPKKLTLRYYDRSFLQADAQIYFGPVQSAAQYFHELGFERPLRAITPDFLTSLTNPDERITREGFKDSVPRSPDEFANAWKRSAQARQLLVDIQAFNDRQPPLTAKPTTSSEKNEWKDKLK